MNETFINQMEPWFGSEEKEAICKYMDSNGWLTEFKYTTEFESLIAAYTGVPYCIAVNNGTISLSLMAIASGIKSGDEVIVPNYTMIATPNSLKLIGAVPVFVDVEYDTLCMDIKQVKKAISSKTKAVIFVNANGRYPICGIEPFVDLCKEHNLILLEDSAQSLGSYYPNGKHQGTIGLAGSFSFSVPKVISTGQGGAIITDNPDFADKIKKMKDFGRSKGGIDIHDSIGWNFKFTDLQAIIGIEQIKKLDWRVERKKVIYNRYRDLLNPVKNIKFFKQDLEFTTPWFIDVRVENRDELQVYLRQKGIGTRVMYPPINRQNAYNQEGYYPVSTEIGKKGLWLPSSSQLTDEKIDFICEKITEFYAKE